MRRTGRITGRAVDLERRDHVAWCAEGPTGFARLASQVVAEAPPDEQVVVVASLDSPDWDPAAHFAGEIGARRLVLADVADVYEPVVAGAPGYRRRQLQQFEIALDDAHAAGFDAVRVVADNTSMLTDSDAMTERWLDWEQVADRWQTGQSVIGICCFDGTKVPAERLARIAQLHPLARGLAEPAVRLYHDASGADPADGTVRLVLDGAIEWFDQNEFRGRLRAEAIAVAESADGDLDIDLGNVDYMHHSGLLALNDVASLFVDPSTGRDHLHLHNAPPVVRRLHSLMPDLYRVTVR